MDRRKFLGKGMAGLATCLAAKATFGQTCYPIPPGTPVQRASINLPTFIPIEQECPEWCWAASIAMIFEYYGHPIDQKAIVKAMFGAVVCAPAGNTRTIGQALSGNWVDANGVPFQSRVVAAFDPANGINAMNNAVVVNELASNHPLLYCNTHHAMVNVAVDFVPTQMGPQVINVGVADPWPWSPRFHPLSCAEIIPVPAGEMTFLATVRVS